MANHIETLETRATTVTAPGGDLPATDLAKAVSFFSHGQLLPKFIASAASPKTNASAICKNKQQDAKPGRPVTAIGAEAPGGRGDEIGQARPRPAPGMSADERNLDRRRRQAQTKDEHSLDRRQGQARPRPAPGMSAPSAPGTSVDERDLDRCRGRARPRPAPGTSTVLAPGTSADERGLDWRRGRARKSAATTGAGAECGLGAGAECGLGAGDSGADERG